MHNRWRRRAALAAAGVALFALAGVAARAADEPGEPRRSFLILPVASGTPGQEASARALGWALEESLTPVGGVRIVSGAEREGALRELASREALTPEEFREICRRAGADVALLGGSTLAEGRLALEVRVFDAAAGRELLTFRGEEDPGAWFALVGAAVRHVAGQVGLGLRQQDEARLSRRPAATPEAYVAYRAALLEEQAQARIEKLRAALALDPDYPEAALRLGVELFRGGSAEALPALERAARLAPRVAEAHNNLGVAYATAGRAGEARKEFEDAVALDPRYADARLNLARLLEERGALAEAEEQYAAILETDAGHDKARFGLAALYDRTGRPELAVREFRVLSSRRPDLAESEFVRVGQEARKSRDYPRAEKYFQRAAEINPQSAQAWAELGTNSYLAGEFTRGVEYFRKAIAIDPGRAEYHYYLGLALARGRAGGEAVEAFRRSVELGGPPEARLGLARAALDGGDPGRAVEELNRLLAANPEHAEAKTLLAQATAEMEARRRLLEGQSQFANQRLSRLEQIVADVNRTNAGLEERLETLARAKQLAEEEAARLRADTERRVAEAEARGARQAASSPDAATLERLRGELDAEREARRREVAGAQAALAAAQAQKEQADRDLGQERERQRREHERLQAELAAAQATAQELGRGSGESSELQRRVAGLQAELARAQTELAQEREARKLEAARAASELAAEREGRRTEVARLKEELAASAAPRRERDALAAEAAQLKGRLSAVETAAARAEQGLAAERAKAEAALLAERERSEKALGAEREGRRADLARLAGELEAERVKKRDQEQLSKDLAQEKERAAQLRSGLGKLEQEAAAQRARLEKELAAEREGRRAEAEKLGGELEAERVKKREVERLAGELAQEKEGAARLRADLEKLGQERAAERGRLEQELAAERAGRAADAAQARAAREAALSQLGQEAEAQRAALEQERAAERGRLEKELAAERAGRAADAERARAEQAAALSRLGEEAAAQRAALERQQAAERGRLERELAEAQARAAAAAAALERRAAESAAALAEREAGLQALRQSVRDLALELARLALRARSWEQAVGYLDQAAAADPASAEAWRGLGEAYFQLGDYEKSKQMYLREKSIY